MMFQSAILGVGISLCSVLGKPITDFDQELEAVFLFGGCEAQLISMGKPGTWCILGKSHLLCDNSYNHFMTGAWGWGCSWRGKNRWCFYIIKKPRHSCSVAPRSLRICVSETRVWIQNTQYILYNELYWLLDRKEAYAQVHLKDELTCACQLVWGLGCCFELKKKASDFLEWHWWCRVHSFGINYIFYGLWDQSIRWNSERVPNPEHIRPTALVKRK